MRSKFPIVPTMCMNAFIWATDLWPCPSDEIQGFQNSIVENSIEELALLLDTIEPIVKQTPESSNPGMVSIS